MLRDRTAFKRQSKEEHKMEDQNEQVEPVLEVEIEELEPKIAPDASDTVLPLALHLRR